MTGLRFLYRLLGVLWVVVAGVILLLTLAYLFVYDAINQYFLVNLPTFSQLLAPYISSLAPGLQHALGLIFGAFCLMMGFGMLSMKTWARTVGMVFHILMGGIVVALSIMLFMQISSIDAVTANFPSLAKIVLFLGVALGIVLLAVGLHLGSSQAMDAFSGDRSLPPARTDVKCPTCGGSLDLSRLRCPKCDADLDAMPVPARVRLRDLQSNQEYVVATRRLNHIGRDQPDLEIDLDYPSVSGNHAMIEYVDGHFYLHALKDTNGTFVNGQRVRDRELMDSDEVAFGAARFQFQVTYSEISGAVASE